MYSNLCYEDKKIYTQKYATYIHKCTQKYATKIKENILKNMLQ